MSTAAQTQSWDRPSRRRCLRRMAKLPVDVTVLRSGIPDTFPGRAVDLGEGGVAAVLAGELTAGEAVAVELQFSPEDTPLRVRALVKHHDRLRSGMEFQGLSVEQKAAIRQWAAALESPPETGEPSGRDFDREGRSKPPAGHRRWLWPAVALLVLITLAVGWWRWNRGWNSLEAGLKTETAAGGIHAATHVPAEVMQKLITHRVNPDYPDAARRQNLSGVIVLDVLVGSDGFVKDVHPRNGPDVLSQAAVDALRWWRFEPYRIDGQPVAVETTVAVEFKPGL